MTGNVCGPGTQEVRFALPFSGVIGKAPLEMFEAAAKTSMHVKVM